jgi:hypothetical protein
MKAEKTCNSIATAYIGVVWSDTGSTALVATVRNLLPVFQQGIRASDALMRKGLQPVCRSGHLVGSFFLRRRGGEGTSGRTDPAGASSWKGAVSLLGAAAGLCLRGRSGGEKGRLPLTGSRTRAERRTPYGRGGRSLTMGEAHSEVPGLPGGLFRRPSCVR